MVLTPCGEIVCAVHLEARRRISGRAGTSSGADLSLRVRYEYEVGGERHTGTRFAWAVASLTLGALLICGELRST